jgi:hypothetical protein
MEARNPPTLRPSASPPASPVLVLAVVLVVVTGSPRPPTHRRRAPRPPRLTLAHHEPPLSDSSRGSDSDDISRRRFFSANECVPKSLSSRLEPETRARDSSPRLKPETQARDSNTRLSPDSPWTRYVLKIYVCARGGGSRLVWHTSTQTIFRMTDDTEMGFPGFLFPRPTTAVFIYLSPS